MTLLRKNLLNKALKLIPSENYLYYQFKEDEINELGIKTPAYYNPVLIKGSVQSVENSLYQQLGLSQEKNYKIFYGAKSINGNATQNQPDKFLYDGKIYETVKITNWFNYDGWSGVLTVEKKDERLNDT